MKRSRLIQTIYQGVLCGGLLVFCLQATSQAGIVLSVPKDNAREVAAITEARKSVANGEIDKARETLAPLAGNPNTPMPDLILVELLFDHGNAPEARRLLESLSLEIPQKFEVVFAFAKLAAAEGRWFECELHAVSAAAIAMPDSWTKEYQQNIRLEVARLRLQSISMRRAWPSVVEFGEQLIAEHGFIPSVGRDVAQAELHLGNVQRALEYLRMAVEADPQSIFPELGIAKLFSLNRDNKNAEKYFRLAIKQTSAETQITATLEYARWLILSARPADAVELLESMPASNTEASRREAIFLRAMSLRMDGQRDAAKIAIEELLSIDPDSFAGRNQLALLLLESSDEADRLEAAKIAKSNSERFPNQIDAWSTLGWVFLNQGDFDLAKQCLDRPLQARVVSKDTAFFLAVLNAKTGDAESTLKLLDKIQSADGPFFYPTDLLKLRASLRK